MKKRILMLLTLISMFLISNSQVIEASSELLNAAKNVNDQGGSVTFIIVLLTVIIIGLCSIIVYLYKQTQLQHTYIREISEKALVSISGMTNVLDNINATHNMNYNKLSANQDKMLDNITEIKFKKNEQ